jgi:hypothetical protein
MRAILAFGVAAAALLAAGAASAGEPTVEIKNAVARVIVVPEARSDIQVVFKSTNASLPLTLRRRPAARLWQEQHPQLPLGERQGQRRRLRRRRGRL